MSFRHLRPGLDPLETRDNPGSVFGDFFSGLVGRAEVLTYYGAGAIKSAFEHGPSQHVETARQRREQQRVREVALSHVVTVPVAATTVAVAPAFIDPSASNSGTPATTATTNVTGRPGPKR